MNDNEQPIEPDYDVEVEGPTAERMLRPRSELDRQYEEFEERLSEERAKGEW